MKVVVTGTGACLARPLLPRLCEHPDVDRIVGLDLAPSGLRHPKLREHVADVRDADLGRYFDGADAVVHMAFVVMRGRLGRARLDRELVRSVNVGGSINVFERAREAGVKRIVHLSSASVYGAWPDNPPAMGEDHPRRGIPGFAYAEDKVAVEDWLDEFERRRDAPGVVRLRPHVILGPHAQPLLLRLLRQPFYPRLPEPEPKVQCVWEDDVANATVQALLSDVRGAFNLAAHPPMAFRELQTAARGKAWPLPLGLVKTLHKVAWRFTGAWEEPAWLAGMAYPLVVDTTRARRELGWSPNLSTLECARQAVRVRGAAR